MAYKLITPAADPVVSLDIAKQHCKVTNNLEDALIELYIAGAVERWESETGYLLKSQTWEFSADSFSGDGIVRLFKCPFISLVSITCPDADGNDMSVDVDTVRVDNVSFPARLAPKTAWPVFRPAIGAVRIRFMCGAVAIPKAVMMAIYMMVAHAYEHREETSEVNLIQVPSAVERIMDLYRIAEHR